MGVDFIKYRRWFIALATLFMPGISSALILEDKTSFGTNISSRHLFHYNPALIQVDKTIISAIHMAGRRSVSMVGSPDGGGTHMSSSLEETEQAAGVLIPVGGASLGLTHVLSSHDNRYSNEDISRDMTETERARRWSLRFVVDLTATMRFGFAYRYNDIQNQIYGNYGLQTQDFTAYRGSLNGYTIGLCQDVGSWGFGIYHAPPMRGKASVEGEQKIITDPGTSGIDLIFRPSGSANFGVSATRWFHKRDDFAPLSTSPIDQRRISLNGIDLEQYLFPVQTIQVGMDYFFRKEWSARLAASKNTATFIFDESVIPGESRNREQRFDWYGLKASGTYTKETFHLELGKIYGQRKKNRLRDTQGTFGHGVYGNYKAKDDFFFLALSFDN